ncbi:MAG: hypothetical protein JO001_16400 [Alphaproteobacteria bacterium]|nr:hypothetical protein [Alphaproteobacteria bacterium]
MPLLQQQILLGRCLLATDPEAVIATAPTAVLARPAEVARLQELIHGDGFQFTRAIHRSWCVARAAGAVRMTLSVLAPEQRRRLLDDWVEAGGGNALDVTTEAAGFLDVVAQHLPDPSHALSICRMEQAAYRASAAAACFTPPNPTALNNPWTMLRRGSDAALVRFLAEPRRVFEALAAGEPLPPFEGSFPYLFAPGLATLRRPATPDETALWDRLLMPTRLGVLGDNAVSASLIGELLAVGAITLAQPS